MKKEHIKNIFIVFLLGLAAFSVFKYVDSLREKYELMNALGETKDEVTVLTGEKQVLTAELERGKQLQEQLSQENTSLKESLKVNEERLAQLDSDFARAQGLIEQMNEKFSLLKAENRALNDRKDKLSTQLSQVTQENDNLKVKISSVKELKKAMRELKRQARKVSVAIKEKVRSVRKITEGNRGYLVKNGQINSAPRVKIEVVPAPAAVKE
jgi:chromosome segregation ATPase